MSHIRCLLSALFLWIAFAGAPVYSADLPAIDAGAADVLHRKAIDAARAGRTVEALSVLDDLVRRFPQRQDYRGDYAVVLGWSGEHAKALELLGAIDRATAPAYVIEGFANSARRQQSYELAEGLYREAITRFPERVEPQIGLALTLADAGRLDEAAAFIEQVRIKYPRNIDVLMAVAEIATARRDYFGALAAYQAILAIEPAHRPALKGKVLTLMRLGTPQLAIELADSNPGLLSSEEYDAVAADRTGQRVRWGAIAADSGLGSGRFEAIDRALADSEAAAARALDPAAELSAVERTLVFDRIVALRDRFRMRDAVALYSAMVPRKPAPPAWAKTAPASAYLYLQEPDRARDLYREALDADPDNPDNLESLSGLFYALAENEQHGEALTEVDRAVKATPQWIDAWSPATTRENPAYARVLSARAMAPLFANRVGEAEQRLQVLADRAPFSMGIRTDHASSKRARGWPRAAEEDLRWIIAADPNNASALGERAGAQLEMRDYRSVGPALAAAQAAAAEDGRVVRATRLSQVHEMRELIVDATAGRSSDGPSGTQDHAIEAWLYSSPLDYQYRAFAHLYEAQAKFANGTGRRERAGIGLEYRSPAIVATGELSHDINESKTGAAASLAWMPNDFWTLRGTADTSANETPLQAGLAGIDARRLSAEAIWRAHESRSAALSLNYLDFSDGNRREATQVRWTERVIAGPVYQLEITGGLYTSNNSLAGAPYFNPTRDFSPTLEFANEWIQWRRYTRAFKHRLVLAVGNYWQEGFGTGPVAAARYEQEWTADDRLVFRYGIGRTLHPYDGTQTARNSAHFSLNWRF